MNLDPGESGTVPIRQTKLFSSEEEDEDEEKEGKEEDEEEEGEKDDKIEKNMEAEEMGDKDEFWRRARMVLMWKKQKEGALPSTSDT